MAPHRQVHNDASAQYFLPNDTEEQQDLNEQARQFEMLMDNNVLHAPISKQTATKLLDVGCGTGYVTYTLANEFPSAEIIGLDLSEVPLGSSKPPNVRFVQGNVMTQAPTSWKPQDHKSTIAEDAQEFDLAFSRLLINGMNDWPGYARRVYDLLKPGGWIEVHELDADFLNAEGKFVSDSWEWYTKTRDGLIPKGLTYNPGSVVKATLEQAGFTDIRVIPYRLPIRGTSEERSVLRAFGDFWGKRLKHVYQVIINSLLPDKEAYVEQMKHDLSQAEGIYNMFFVTIGRKPE